MKVKVLNMALLLSLTIATGCTAAEQQGSTTAMPKMEKQAETKQIQHNIVVAADDTQEFTSDGFPKPKQKPKLTEPPPAPADAMSPLDRVKSAPIGTLHNPYSRDLNSMAPFGKQRFFSNSCNGCHGGTGGGGMCPPLSNSTWVYGNSDDTLFRLIALGSDELQKQHGLTRKGRENVVGPMPAFGGIIKTDDEIWRIISYIRTIYNDDPKGDVRNVH